MRTKLTAAVLFISVFAMNANAFCAGLCATGHVHANAVHAHGEEGHDSANKAHTCHHYPNYAQAVASRHDAGNAEGPQVCHTVAREAAAEDRQGKSGNIDNSGAIIECNCTDEAGIGEAQSSAILKERIHPSTALNLVAILGTAEARPLLSEYSPPEGPPKIS